MSQAANRKHVAEIVKCGKDPVYFMNKYCKIQHPMKGLIDFNTFPFQDDCVKDFNDHRFNIVLKSRQLGLSTLTAAYAVWQSIFYKDKNILIIATKLSVAQNFIRKVKTYLAYLPKWLLVPQITANNKQQVEFSNGSQIKAVPTSEDAGRSEALTLLIVDEAAFVRNFDELWMGLYPTLSTGGRAILLSTPNGVGGQYYDLYKKAELGQNKFNHIKLMWDVHPERDYEWYEKETKNMSEKQIAQELLCDFTASGDTFLNSEIMSKIRLITRAPIEKSGPEQSIWFWEYPLEGVNYVIGADISRGDSADYSTFHVINTKTLDVSAECKTKIPPDKFASVLYDVARRFNKALICPESNAYGYTVLLKLHELGYKNIYFSSEKEKQAYHYGNSENFSKAGFVTSKESKEKILANLEEAIRNHRIKIPSTRTVDEFKTFVWNNNKVGAMRGHNDDLIISLAIALWIAESNSDTYIASQIEMTKAMMKGMELNKVGLSETNISPFYNSKEKYVNPFIPVPMGNSGFSKNSKSPMGDLSWLIKG